MSQQSIVRAATPADESEIWRLFRLLHTENGMFDISEEKVQDTIDRVLKPDTILPGDNGPRGIAGVIGEVGRLEGAIMLIFGTPWYSDVISLGERLNFVDPEHRNSNHAKTLISYAKHMIDQLRLSDNDLRLVIGVLSTKRTAAKVRLYERQLQPAGAFFVYPPPDDHEPIKGFYRTH